MERLLTLTILSSFLSVQIAMNKENKQNQADKNSNVVSPNQLTVSIACFADIPIFPSIFANSVESKESVNTNTTHA